MLLEKLKTGWDRLRRQKERQVAVMSARVDETRHLQIHPVRRVEIWASRQPLRGKCHPA
jgi:hypothetical protein